MVVTTLACPNSSCTVASASPLVGQKGFNIPSRPLFQRFVPQETLKLLRPSDIERRTVRPYPVLLRAPQVGLPKTFALFGIVETHGIHHEIHFNFSRLGNNRTLNDRWNYYITIYDNGDVDLLVGANGIDAVLERMVEGALVKEDQGIHRLVLGGGSDVSVYGELGQERFDLGFGGEEVLTGPHAVETNKPHDPVHVGSLG
jgi:hypothetical protein